MGIVQGIWGPEGANGLTSCPREPLASLSPQGHLFIYLMGPKFDPFRQAASVE